MSIKSKLLKILSLDFLAKIILAVISLSLIRLMSIEDFALYTVIFTAVNLISSLVASVINKLYIVGNFEEEGYSLTNFLSFQIFLVIVLTALIIPIANLFGGYLWLMFPLILLKVFMVFIQTHFQKEMQFRRYYKLEYTRIFFYVCMFLVLLVLGNTITVFEILTINIISLGIAGFYYGFNLLKLNNLLDLKATLGLLKKTMNSEYKYLYFYTVGILFLVNVDVFMLRILDNTYQVAIFGAAFTFYSFLMLGLGAVHKLFLPLINKTNNVLEIKKFFKEHNKISLFLIPVLILGLFISPYIIPLIDNGKYPESIIIFQILAVSAYISFFLSPYSNVLLRFKEFKFQFVFVSLFVLFHIILNLYIIPNYHAIGLAWANLFMYGAFNFIVYLKALRLLNKI